MNYIPCKDCPNRSAACHDTCDEYITTKRKQDETNVKKYLSRLPIRYEQESYANRRNKYLKKYGKTRS